MKQILTGSIPNFKPRQIVCLEHENTHLYAEVIQVVTSRRLCWVRPLILAEVANTDVLLAEEGQRVFPAPAEQLVLYDLRSGADLVWPIALFRPAIDTELIPLLAQIEYSDIHQESLPEANKQLSYFIRQVWQAYKNEFLNL